MATDQETIEFLANGWEKEQVKVEIMTRQLTIARLALVYYAEMDGLSAKKALYAISKLDRLMPEEEVE